MATAQEVIKLAEAEVGYLEKKSNAQLDDKTANAGSANYTKYSRDLVSWIGSPYAQGVAWCDQFVDWIMIKAFGKDKAKEILGGWSAYTPTSAQYYKNMSRWYESNPQPGDQIFFKNTERICHTGIVYAVDNSKVYTIEGNTSSSAGVVANGGAVAKKSYALNYKNIAGYGRPKYDSSVGVAVKATTQTLSKGIDISKYNIISNYNALKSAGVQFAILKIIEKNNAVEPSFEKHYSSLLSAGIPVTGVYNYLYCQNEAQARVAANAVITTLKGRKIPVIADVEDSSLAGLGNKLVAIINAYQEVVEAAGLSFILYSGLSYYNSYIKPYKANLKARHLWIARYPSSAQMTFADDPDPAKKPDVEDLMMWQYSSKVKIPAASAGVFDCNILYTPVDVTAKTGTVYNCTALNVRNKPNSSGAIVGRLTAGQKVEIFATENGWVKIAKNSEQWVSAKYIR